jgi:hypothetical protein
MRRGQSTLAGLPQFGMFTGDLRVHCVRGRPCYRAAINEHLLEELGVSALVRLVRL